jgi:hypothetical protein
VEKAAQTITFGDLDSKTVEDADFDLSATSLPQGWMSATQVLILP